MDRDIALQINTALVSVKDSLTVIASCSVPTEPDPAPEADVNDSRYRAEEPGIEPEPETRKK